MKYWRPVVLAAIFLQVIALFSPVTTASGAEVAPEREDSAVQQSGEAESRRPHLVIKRAPGWGKRGSLPRVTLVDDEEGNEDEDLYRAGEWGDLEKRAPGWGKRAPGWGKRAPGWGKRAPGWGKRSSRYVYDSEETDPGLNKRAPGWGKRAPGWGKRAPGWGKRSALSCEDLDDEINHYMDQAMKAEAEKLAKCGNGLNGNESQRK